MAMRELLRIEMSAAQVREACEQWARARATSEMIDTDVVATLSRQSGGAIVVFTKARAPRVRKAKPSIVDAALLDMIDTAPRTLRESGL